MIRRRSEMYIVKDNKVFVGVKGDLIDIPGGGIEEGETPKEAAIRETLEEVGIKVKNISIIFNEPYVIKLPERMKETEQHIYSYKGDFEKFDKEIWGDGPEGKYYPALIEIKKLIKYFETKALNSDEDWNKFFYLNIMYNLKGFLRNGYED